MVIRGHEKRSGAGNRDRATAPALHPILGVDLDVEEQKGAAARRTDPLRVPCAPSPVFPDDLQVRLTLAATSRRRSAALQAHHRTITTSIITRVPSRNNGRRTSRDPHIIVAGPSH